MTGERTLPVLDAVHIKPYALVKRHELPNGLLMRSDLHKLFDSGYLTVDPKDRCVVVSKRIREEFENGKDYYKLQGQVLREPNECVNCAPDVAKFLAKASENSKTLRQQYVHLLQLRCKHRHKITHTASAFPPGGQGICLEGKGLVKRALLGLCSAIIPSVLARRWKSSV